MADISPRSEARPEELTESKEVSEVKSSRQNVDETTNHIQGRRPGYFPTPFSRR